VAALSIPGKARVHCCVTEKFNKYLAFPSLLVA
jgi:hypothetical protein